MKLLHAIHSLNPLHGGTTYGLTGLIDALTKLGHSNEIAVLDNPGSAWLQNWACPVHAFGTGAGNYGFNPALALRSLKVVREFDWVIIHGLWQFHGLALSLACRLAHIPYAVFPHGMLDGWQAKVHPNKHRYKTIYWKLIERRVLKNAHRVFFTTQGELDAGSTTYKPFDVQPAFAPFGISKPDGQISDYREDFAKKRPELKDKKTFLFLGRLHPKKGCDILISGFSLWLANQTREIQALTHLRLVGPHEDPDYVQMLMNMGTQAGLFERGQLSISDAVSGDEKWQELSHAEALILPSHQENFGVVIAEALSTATPVLISDKVNGWENIAAAGAGWVAPDDELGVVSLLDKWGGMTISERSAMSTAAENYFITSMSSDVSAERLLSALASQP